MKSTTKTTTNHGSGGEEEPLVLHFLADEAGVGEDGSEGAINEFVVQVLALGAIVVVVAVIQARANAGVLANERNILALHGIILGGAFVVIVVAADLKLNGFVTVLLLLLLHDQS